MSQTENNILIIIMMVICNQREYIITHLPIELGTMESGTLI